MNVRYSKEMYLKVWKDVVPLSVEVKFSSGVPETPVAVPQRPTVQGGSTEVLVQHLHLVGYSVELLCVVQVWSQTIPCCNYLTEIMNLLLFSSALKLISPL